MNRQTVSEPELLGIFLAIQFEFLSEPEAQELISTHVQSESADMFMRLAESGKLLHSQIEIIQGVIATLNDQSPNLSQFVERFCPENSVWPKEVLPESCRSFVFASAVEVEKSKLQETRAEATGSMMSEFENTDDDDWSLAESLIRGVEEQRDPKATRLANFAGQRYDVASPLAEGGLGCVSVAIDREFNRQVAFKQIKSVYVRDPESQRRFLFEAKITGRLEHPGIIPVYSLGCDTEQQPFYAMRLIEGDSLRDALRRFHKQEQAAQVHDGSAASGAKTKVASDYLEDGDFENEPSQTPEEIPTSAMPQNRLLQDSSSVLEFRQLLAHFVDLCNAMEYAHSQGVIHRDIKPSNVMVGPFGETIVLDWGLARQLGDTAESGLDQERDSLESGEFTRAGAVVGTVVYMSPEQAMGNSKTLGPAADIYSLGATLYEILTGRTAITSEEFGDRPNMLAAAKSGTFQPPAKVAENVPAPLNAICLKAMRLKPEDRYASARALADDVERWLADEPVHAWREPFLVRSRRWMKRHRALVASSIVAVFTAMVGLAVIAAVQSDSNRKLTIANDRVTGAKQLAERQFDLAVKAIGQYHQGVTNDFLLGQAEFQSLRNSLIVGPRKFYRELAAIQQEAAQPTLDQRLALIESHLQLAQLANDVNEQQAAIDEYLRVLELNAGLRQDFPDRLDFIETKGRTMLSLAVSYSRLGKYEEAQENYESAKATFESIKLRDSEFPSIDALIASSAYQFAVFLSESSRPQEAAERFEVAEKSYRQLVAENPEDTELQESFAECLAGWSNLEWDEGAIDSAIKRGEESLKLQNDLLEKDAANLSNTFTLAATMTNLAYLYQDSGQLDRAMELYGQSEAAFDKLIEEAPNVVRLQNGLASTLTNMGLLYAEKKDRVNAERVYRKALKIKERIINNSPNSIDYAVSLAGGYANFGGYLHGFQEYQPALEWYNRAIEVLDGLLAKTPTQSRARMFNYNVHFNRARALRNLGRFQEAARDFEVAIEFNDDESRAGSLRNQRMQMLAQSSEHAEGSRLANEAMESAETDGDFFNLAFIQALAVGAAKDDPALSDAERPAALSLYSNRAVEALRAMFDTNALTEEQFLSLLNNNEYLEPLHDQEVYQQLVEEFEE